MKVSYEIIDAFTSSPFSGNPASVILLEKEEADTLTDDIRQKIAAEFNLAETAFLVPLEGCTPERPKFQLRWFTPTQEFPLCGHATLASAHFIFSLPSYASATEIEFHSPFSGLLLAGKNGEKIELNFPSIPTIPVSQEEEQKVRAGAESTAPEFVGKVEEVRLGKLGEWEAWLIRLRAGTTLEGLKIDFNYGSTHAWAKTLNAFTVPNTDPKKKEHFSSRLFDPVEGEDPVTGSAHAMLGPYWASHGREYISEPPHSATDTLHARQVSDRGGDLELQWDGADRVAIRGQAITVSKGVMEW
ncbi:phenazine biosynthesis PhzC/PhzF protein [Atractiella rhizophila]|nr:phenazine biosynthesis PhzC/PhzF protein [Atractiella rhizophila]